MSTVGGEMSKAYLADYDRRVIFGERPIADPVALIHDVSRDNVTSLRCLHAIPTAERRENLLALAVAIHAAGRPLAHLEAAVRYFAVTADPMPAWGRLLVAVRECDEVEVDKALARLVGESE